MTACLPAITLAMQRSTPGLCEPSNLLLDLPASVLLLFYLFIYLSVIFTVFGDQLSQNVPDRFSLIIDLSFVFQSLKDVAMITGFLGRFGEIGLPHLHSSH